MIYLFTRNDCSHALYILEPTGILWYTDVNTNGWVRSYSNMFGEDMEDIGAICIGVVL